MVKKPGMIAAAVGRTVAKETQAAKEQPHPEGAPFEQGEVVSLKSGGFPMVVEFVRATSDPKRFFVEVVWASDKSYSQDIHRETFPSCCLHRELLDDIPF